MDNKKEARILNALRMGVIPDVDLGDIIYGRKTEIKEIEHVFKLISEEECSLVKYIKGEYGTGKSFLLEYIKQKALRKNYVVASISISSSFNFSKFDDLYRNVMANLSILQKRSCKGTDFEELFDLWIKNTKKNNDKTEATRSIYNIITELSTYNSSFANVLSAYIRAKICHDYNLAEIAASWIKGDRNLSYELKKKLGVKGSVDRENAIEMLRGFAMLLKSIGYTGLIIEVDETELIMMNRSDIRMKAYSNIRYIMDLCGSNEIENTCFVFAGTNDLFVNEEKGFKSYKALEQRIGEIGRDSKNIVNNARNPVIYLREFKDEEWLEILENVMGFHEKYYGYEHTADVKMLYKLTETECVKEIKNKKITVRLFIKKLIEVLDLMESNPDLPIFKAKINYRTS